MQEFTQKSYYGRYAQNKSHNWCVKISLLSLEGDTLLGLKLVKLRARPVKNKFRGASSKPKPMFVLKEKIPWLGHIHAHKKIVRALKR